MAVRWGCMITSYYKALVDHLTGDSADLGSNPIFDMTHQLLFNSQDERSHVSKTFSRSIQNGFLIRTCINSG